MTGILPGLQLLNVLPYLVVTAVVITMAWLAYKAGLRDGYRDGVDETTDVLHRLMPDVADRAEQILADHHAHAAHGAQQ